MKTYLDRVASNKLPINNQILYNIQNILNLLPNLNLEELISALLIKTNDMHLIIYVSSLVRSILALHDLLNNKLKYKDLDAILDRNSGIDNVNNNGKDKKGSGTEANTPVAESKEGKSPKK